MVQVYDRFGFSRSEVKAEAAGQMLGKGPKRVESGIHWTVAIRKHMKQLSPIVALNELSVNINLWIRNVTCKEPHVTNPPFGLRSVLSLRGAPPIQTNEANLPAGWRDETPPLSHLDGVCEHFGNGELP